jgi:hypothetical protein
VSTDRTIRARFARIFDTCQPYLVKSAHGAASEPRPSPIGLDVDAARCFDPLAVRSGPFLTILQRLDELTFGPIGMTMPRWVFYDCAEVPGGIFGFSRPAAEVPEWVLRALHVEPGYDGPVPLSMVVAIPMLRAGCWHTYTVCSLNEVAPGSAPAGLRQLTQAASLQIFGVETAYGATQWRSSKLRVHAQFAPLELLTSWTPAHSDPRTLTYRFAVSDELVERALVAAPPTPTGTVRWVDCDDDDALIALQHDIESGRRFQVVGGPEIEGSTVRAPLVEVTS